MRKCPLCGRVPRFGMPSLLQLADGNWSFAHHCSRNTTIFIVADTKEEVLEIWEGNRVEEHPAE